jgi:hypothetical protein
MATLTKSASTCHVVDGLAVLCPCHRLGSRSSGSPNTWRGQTDSSGRRLLLGERVSISSMHQRQYCIFTPGLAHGCLSHRGREACTTFDKSSTGPRVKTSHWMWYMFPILFSISTSTSDERCAIRGVHKARESLSGDETSWAQESQDAGCWLASTSLPQIMFTSSDLQAISHRLQNPDKIWSHADFFRWLSQTSCLNLS